MAKKEILYKISIRCYYENSFTTHKQIMKLSEIAKWIEAYKFTHPNVEGFSIRLFIDEPLEESYAENKTPDSS